MSLDSTTVCVLGHYSELNTGSDSRNPIILVRVPRSNMSPASNETQVASYEAAESNVRRLLLS